MMDSADLFWGKKINIGRYENMATKIIKNPMANKIQPMNGMYVLFFR